MTPASAPTQRRIAEELRRRIAALAGVEERPLRLAHATVPRAYWMGETEFVHFHGVDQIDLRVPDADLRGAMLRDPRAKVNPYARSRIEFDFRSVADADDAFRLVRQVHARLRAAAPRAAKR